MEQDSGYECTGSANDSSILYETRMLELVALRLFNGKFEKFHVASNLAKADKFDDVVFSAKKGDTWIVYFIQLKHRLRWYDKPISLKSLSLGRGDYSIPKYFESFIKIKEALSVTCDSSDVIFGKPNAATKFFLFTNGIILNDGPHQNRQNIDIGFMSTGTGSELNFKLGLDTDNEMITKLTERDEDKVNPFMNHFHFCSGQIGESGIDQLIYEEIKKSEKSVELSVNDLKNLQGKLFKLVRQMAKKNQEGKEGQFITEKDTQNLFTEANLYAQSGKKLEVDVKFKQNFLDELMSNLPPGKPIFLKCNGAKIQMCMAALKQLDLLDEPNHEVSLSKLNKETFKYFTYIWGLTDTRSLVIDCESGSFNLDQEQIVKSLCGRNTNNHRIILVAAKDNSAAVRLAVELNANEQMFDCSPQNLAEESLDRLLKCKFQFQGYETTITSLLPDSKRLDEVFDMDTMKNFLTGERIEVGIKLEESVANYVPRVLTRPTVTSSVIFNSPPGNYFALSGITYDEAVASFQNMEISGTYTNLKVHNPSVPTKQIYVLEGSDLQAEFNKLLSIKSNFHWLHRNKKYKMFWHWQQSNGNIKLILNNVTESWEHLKTDNVMAINDKVVIVSAESGMGKTTLVNNFAVQTKKRYPQMWVMSVQLSDYSDNFFDETFSNDIKRSVRNIIAKAAGVDSNCSKFNSKLFDHCYDVSGNMIVLLDGFDEISPTYAEKGIQFLTTLQESSVSRVLVTTRPIWAKRLQTETSTLCFSIPPLNEREQKKFLKNFCEHKTKNETSEDEIGFINKVLKLISGSFGKGHNEFAGNPLHLKMVAEVYDQRQNLPMQINSLLLFENVVNKKLDIIFDEKLEKESKNDIIMSGKKVLRDDYVERLIKLALLTLLPLDTCSTLIPPIDETKYEELKEYVLKGKEKAGFVVSFPARFPQFNHRAFAEYFVAQFLVKHFKTNRNLIKSEDFFSPSFNFVQDFLNRMLAKGKTLHEKVLQGALSLNTNDIKKELDSRDQGGRTALHVAAALPKSKSAIDILLGAGADPKIADDVLEWNPVDYAIRLKHFENIGPLLEKSQPRSEVGDVVPTTWRSLRMAISGDYKELLLHLLKNDIISKVSKVGTQYLSNKKWINNSNNENLTLLHVAAWHNSSKILKYLLSSDRMDCKFQIEYHDDKQRTPLLLAVSNRCLEAVRLLVEAKANLLATTGDKKDIVRLTIELHDENMLKFTLKAMKSQGVDPEMFLKDVVTPLTGDKSSWGLLMLQFLLFLYPELKDAKTKKSVPLIIAACIKGNEDAVGVLSKVADVNIVHRSSTPLHFAARGGHLEVVKVLLQCPGIQVDALDDRRETPFGLARSKSYFTIGDLLKKHGANTIESQMATRDSFETLFKIGQDNKTPSQKQGNGKNPERPQQQMTRNQKETLSAKQNTHKSKLDPTALVEVMKEITQILGKHELTDSQVKLLIELADAKEEREQNNQKLLRQSRKKFKGNRQRKRARKHPNHE